MIGMDYKTAIRLTHSSNNLTSFERRTGVKNVGVEDIVKTREMVIHLVKKSNGTSTLQILFKVSPATDKWLIWTPTKGQVKELGNLNKLYVRIDEKNQQNLER